MKYIFIAYLLVCCSKEEQATTQQLVAFQLGETKILNYSSSREIIVNKIKFDSVRDERCPREDCSLCYGGYVYAYFLVQTNNSVTFDTLKLHRISCIPIGDLQIDDPNMDSQSIKGLRFGLVNITELTKNMSSKIYSAKITIMP